MSKKSPVTPAQNVRTISFFALAFSILLWVAFGGATGAFVVFLNRFSPALKWNAEFRLALIHGATLGASCQILILSVVFFSDTFILFKYLKSRSRSAHPPSVPNGPLRALLEQTWFEATDSKIMPKVRIFPFSKPIQMRVRAPFRRGEWWISQGYLASRNDAEIQRDFQQILTEVPRMDCIIQTWAACVGLFWAILGSVLSGAERPAISSSSSLALNTYLKSSWGYIPALISMSMIHLIKSWVQTPQANTSLDFNVLDVVSSNLSKS